MLNESPIITFLATKNAGSARHFYEIILGLTFIADEPFALVFDLQGTPLRLQKVEQFKPHPFTVFGWQVKNIEEKIKALQLKNVVFEHFPGLAQDKLGICIFPDGTKVAWFKDPDGNLLSLTQLSI